MLTAVYVTTAADSVALVTVDTDSGSPRVETACVTCDAHLAVQGLAPTPNLNGAIAIADQLQQAHATVCPGRSMP